MRAPICVASALAALVALASGCRPEPAETHAAPQHRRDRPVADTTVMTPPADSLGLKLVLPRQVRAGEPLVITLRIQNRAGRTLDLYLRGRTITFDVVVARHGGEVVWRRLEDEIIPAIVHLRPLAPGEWLEAKAGWDQRTKQGRRLESGEYVARGFLLVEGNPLETPPAAFRVVEQ